MQQVLVYADSLTWGIIPDTRRRLPFAQRWVGVMEIALGARGGRVRVIDADQHRGLGLALAARVAALLAA